jgi:pyruvate ferredoxin oxidoreductase beta subunit
MTQDMTIAAARLAVSTGAFPLLEIENGARTIVSHLPDRKTPVAEYLKVQGRFAHLTDEMVEAAQRAVDERWRRLEAAADEVREIRRVAGKGRKDGGPSE